MSIALLLLTGCAFFGGDHTEYWSGTTVKFDGDGVQDGNGGRVLIEADYSSPDARVIEQVWRDEDVLSNEVWDVGVLGQDAETMGSTPAGSYAILGEFTAGEPYHWTEWTWTWTWLDGDQAGEYTRIEATIVEEFGARASYIRHIEHRDGQDNLLWSRDEELAEQSPEEFEALRAGL